MAHNSVMNTRSDPRWRVSSGNDVSLCTAPWKGLPLEYAIAKRTTDCERKQLRRRCMKFWDDSLQARVMLTSCVVTRWHDHWSHLGMNLGQL